MLGRYQAAPQDRVTCENDKHTLFSGMQVRKCAQLSVADADIEQENDLAALTDCIVHSRLSISSLHNA